MVTSFFRSVLWLAKNGKVRACILTETNSYLLSTSHGDDDDDDDDALLRHRHSTTKILRPRRLDSVE